MLATITYLYTRICNFRTLAAEVTLLLSTVQEGR